MDSDALQWLQWLRDYVRRMIANSRQMYDINLILMRKLCILNDSRIPLSSLHKLTIDHMIKIYSLHSVVSIVNRDISHPAMELTPNNCQFKSII